jgi:hypothetical protein
MAIIIHLLEYYEEIEYDGFTIEKYSLLGVYLSEDEALKAVSDVASSLNIKKGCLFVSSTKMGKLQWEGGFITV